METEPCDFLDKLPFEIRLRIYEFHLTYLSPIKPRYILPGTKDLPILRLNRQIHEEAIKVLYERNRVAVKYAYFCKTTPPEDKSPIKTERIRHLLIDGLRGSLMCNAKAPYWGCTICSDLRLDELIGSLKAFPRLRTVVIDYNVNRNAMNVIRLAVEESDEFEFVNVEGRPDPCAYKLQGPELGGIHVEFRCGITGWIDHAIQDQIDWV